MRPARRSAAARQLITGLALASLTVTGLPILGAAVDHGVDVASREVTVSVDGPALVRLPIAASHVALRWPGAPDAEVEIALGRSPDQLSEDIHVHASEPSPLDAGTSYSDVIWADGARFVRITTDRPMAGVRVVAMDTDASRGIDASGAVSAAVDQPNVITRAGWGANEAYRHNSGGYVRYAQTFAPLQKLIVHHTAGRNNDPNPAATIRAIYYDHAILRGYGDIDYHFLVDAQGRVYEGRAARDYLPGEDPTGEDLAGLSVRASHASFFNDGTMGVVLLGNFTGTQPTPAARTALVNLLAWKAERHGINPLTASTYVNPVLGNSKWLYNISGHRNVNQTACPGQAFYDTFPTLRQQVAARIAATSGAANDDEPPSVATFHPLVPEQTGAHTLTFGLIFEEPVTDLMADDLGLSGTSSDWTIEDVTGDDATYVVTVVADEGGNGPEDGSVVLTLAAGGVTDLAGLAGPETDESATVDFAAEDEPPVAVLYAVATRGEAAGTSYGISIEFNEPVVGFNATDIAVGGSSHAKEAWTVETLYGSGAVWNFTISNPSPPTGTLTVQIPAGVLKDLAGNDNADSNVIQRYVDHSAPTTSAPRLNLRADTTLWGSDLRTTIGWSGSDVGPAGIGSYDVARSRDGGAFVTIGSKVTATSMVWSLQPGHTYRFRVRARDKAGNLSGWKTGSTVRALLTQQNSGAVVFTGPSATAGSSSYSGGSERHLAAAGASVRFTTTARSLSFITTKGPNRGQARIYIDGVLRGTVDLSAPTTTYRFVAFSMTWASVGTHTIRVVSVGTPVPRVDIDGFGIIR